MPSPKKRTQEKTVLRAGRAPNIPSKRHDFAALAGCGGRSRLSNIDLLYYRPRQAIRLRGFYQMPNALLVYPQFPPSYWSEKYALQFIGRRAAMPPLGLLTVAALFPDHYTLRVVDMNVEPLRDQDLAWADAVFISAMIVQKKSFEAVVARARAAGKRIIAGGPYVTSFYEEIDGVDHLVLGEVEEFFQHFLADLEHGRAPRIYRGPQDGAPAQRPDIAISPPPRYDLIELRHYNSMAIQFSRGCPYNLSLIHI